MAIDGYFDRSFAWLIKPESEKMRTIQKCDVRNNENENDIQVQWEIES